MDTKKVEQVTTDDGCHSLYVPSLDEHYHSTHGAFNEAMHVFIQHGFRATTGAISILEVGFGTGLNAWLTCLEAETAKRAVNYVGLETYPLPNDVTSKLNYTNFSDQENAQQTFQDIHQVRWETPQKISKDFELTKTETSLHEIDFENQFDVIYFDAFGPRKQPDMWTIPVFEKMYQALKKDGFLVTYCAQGQVKRNMKAAGFVIENLPGPPGKREMTKGIKKV
jgi:tRNA U34 5-methylaminomethyl-2-thiouridine-forming methyltransferase MnmC